jgi:LacI family transcriptional regulator
VRRRERRAVTIREVARLARVSPATVTRVLQGARVVRDETRQRVEEAVRALGYRPDHVARALVTRSTRTVGMVLPSSGDSFWGEVAAGIEERASEEGFSVLFANAHGSAEREFALIELFLSKRVQGIIVAGAAGEPSAWFRALGPDVPVVLVNWDAELGPAELEAARSGPPEQVGADLSRAVRVPEGVSHIAFDDLQGSASLVRHLVGLGHRRIAFLGAWPIRPALLRVVGFRRALEEAGLGPGPIVSCRESLEEARDAALALLERPDRPTAIVAYSDLVAIGAIRAAHAAGVRVPQDLSVAGHDDIEVAAFVEPPLTTVGQRKREMGRQAMDWVLARLSGRDVPREDLVPGDLVVRASTGPAPERGRHRARPAAVGAGGGVDPRRGPGAGAAGGRAGLPPGPRAEGGGGLV